MSEQKKAEYEKLKKKLHDAITEKKNIDKLLTLLEEEIYAKETLYLTNSYSHNNAGNIIKGMEGFARSGGIHTSHGFYGGASSRRRTSFTDDDRVFSLSSAIYVKHLQKKNRELVGGNGSAGVPDTLDDDDDDDGDDVADSQSTNGGTASASNSTTGTATSGRKRRKEES